VGDAVRQGQNEARWCHGGDDRIDRRVEGPTGGLDVAVSVPGAILGNRARRTRGNKMAVMRLASFALLVTTAAVAAAEVPSEIAAKGETFPG
jgi:hypothetical protein